MNGDLLQIYAMSAKYTDSSIQGTSGVLAGKNCQITSISPIEGGNRVTFSWFDDNQVARSDSMDVMNGTGGDAVKVEQILTKGTKIAVITVDGTPVSLYAPTGGGGSSTLDGLEDVDLTKPTEGQVLAYDAATETWRNINVSGGSSVLSDDLTTAISVGGIDSGVTYEKGTSLETLFRDLLEPTLFPTLTNPSASITYGASQYYEVKATVNAMQATVALNRGGINPAYGTSGYRAGQATGYAIQTTGADTEFSSSDANSGVFSVPALKRSTKGTIVVKGTVSYAQGEQPKDSKGKDYQSPLPAGSVNASKTLNFIQAYFYGASNSASVANFDGLTKSVTAKGQKTFNFTTNNQFMVFAYDSSYGNLKSIVDGNGFDVTSGWTKNTLTVDGFTYFVYVANSATTDTNAPFTFKY